MPLTNLEIQINKLEAVTKRCRELNRLYRYTTEIQRLERENKWMQPEYNPERNTNCPRLRQIYLRSHQGNTSCPKL